MYWVCATCEGVVADGLAACPSCGCPRRPFVVRVGEARTLHLYRPPTWLEVRVVEFPDASAAGLPYRVVAPDGAVHDGTLDADGRVLLEGLRPGTCRFTVYAQGCAPPPPPVEEPVEDSGVAAGDAATGRGPGGWQSVARDGGVDDPRGPPVDTDDASQGAGATPELPPRPAP